MRQLHRDLIRLSHEFGADEEYVRAGGGNASVKCDGVLYIKPSGTTLATLRDEDLIPLRIDVLLDALHSTRPVDGDPVMAAAQAARVGAIDGRRPSVEILFHALIPDPLVLHLHPLVANAVTCNENGPALAAQLLGEEAIWVDYINPGVPLARGIAAAREAYLARVGSPAPGITLLGNHGIIISGATYAEVAARTRWTTEAIQAAIDDAAEPFCPAPEALDLTPLAEAFRVAVQADCVATQAMARQASLVIAGPLIPDQIVYAGSFPLVVSADADLTTQVAEFRATHGRAPIIAVLPETAVFAVGSSDEAAANALGTYLDALRVARDANRIGRVRVMDECQRHFIEHWEAEAYRKQVSSEKR